MGAEHEKNEGGGHPNRWRIIVNARPREIEQQVLTFADVVALAFPHPPTGENILYTVTYNNAQAPAREGILVGGQSVTVRDGTIVNVARTDKS